jgi:hypothetical protein
MTRTEAHGQLVPNTPASLEAPGLTFGIFPGMTGTEPGLAGGPAHDPERTDEAITQIQPLDGPFLVRGYVLYEGKGRARYRTPTDILRYLYGRRRLDYVLCYRTPDGDLDDWTSFVRQAVREYGPYLDALQVTEEPNNPDAASGGNGSFPRVREAIIAGVIAAKDEVRRQGLSASIGFNATPSFNPNDDFWPEVKRLGGPTFLEALGYVGLDFFPDVFRPVPFERLREAVEGVLTYFRTVNLVTGGIPLSVPIRITEHGWPTGPYRPYDRQADVVETVVRAVNHLRGPHNITHYEFFSLRDGDSGTPDMGTQFGLIRDEYTPKTAFGLFRNLIAELGTKG